MEVTDLYKVDILHGSVTGLHRGLGVQRVERANQPEVVRHAGAETWKPGRRPGKGGNVGVRTW